MGQTSTDRNDLSLEPSFWERWLDRAVMESSVVLKFDTESRRRRAVESDQLVEIAGHATLAEADLVRERLASVGIESCLGNANTVSYCWLYGVAIGGVRVFVMGKDRDSALDIIDEINRFEAEETDGRPNERQCSSCEQTIPADWDICWACGADRSGAVEESFRIVPTPYKLWPLKPLEPGPVPLHLSISFLIFPPFLLFYALLTIWSGRTSVGESDAEHEEHPEFQVVEEELHNDIRKLGTAEQAERGAFDSNDDGPPQPFALYDSIIERALRAAVFGYMVAMAPFPATIGTPGILAMPLLNLYSLWLLAMVLACPRPENFSTDGRIFLAMYLNLALPMLIFAAFVFAVS